MDLEERLRRYCGGGKYLDEVLENLAPFEDGFRHADGALDGVDTDSPFLLVQENLKSSGDYWASSFDSLEAAARYVDGEEYADDWDVALMVDVRINARYRQTTVFVLED